MSVPTLVIGCGTLFSKISIQAVYEPSTIYVNLSMARRTEPLLSLMCHWVEVLPPEKSFLQVSMPMHKCL